MNLTKHPQAAPEILVGPIANGSVYVGEGAPGNVQQGVVAGEKVVVLVGGSPLEVTTVAYPGAVGAPGTYLSAADGTGLAGQAAEIRRYRTLKDGWRKARTLAGLGVWVPGVIGVALAIIGVLALTAGSATDATAVGNAAKRMQVFVVSPSRGAPPSQAARVALATQCLDGLAGGSAPKELEVAGVKCAPAELSFFEDKENLGAIAALAGMITATLAATGTAGKFSFGKQP